MAGMIEPDDIDWDHYMQASEPQQKVRSAAEYEEQVQAYFNRSGEPLGTVLPWAKTHFDIQFRPGEVSVWAGINGHGKSLLLGHAVLWFMAQQQKCLIASFEMKPVVTLARMCRQASCGGSPAVPFISKFHKWTDGRLWLYDQQGQVNVPQIAAVMRYAHEKFGMQHFVIDSLMKCIRGEDDYNGQKDFGDLVTSLARDTGMHVHVVHHMRKRDDETKPGGKFDLKGSGSITDQVDNVFIVWRNKKKQFDKQAGKEVDPSMPDAQLICEKQRNGEWEGHINLWFDERSHQYLGSPDHRAQGVVS